MSSYLVKSLSSLSPYIPGEQPKEGEDYIKLNTNESPFPPIQEAVKRAEEKVRPFNLYCDPTLFDLKKAIASSFSLPQECVSVGNGSDELLLFALLCYTNYNIPLITPDITYGYYSVVASLYDREVIQIPLKDDFSIDVSDYEGKKGTIFIANPNAPTGIFLEREKIEELLNQDKDRIVLIDEAYVDFASNSVLPLINMYPNLIVTQTFSKSRSLAGLRVGMAFAQKHLIEDIERVRSSSNPYNINSFSSSLAIEVLKEEETTKKRIEVIKKNREYITQEYKKLGFDVLPSSANFIFVKSEKIDGYDYYRKLKENGVLIRHFTNSRISSWCRVTVSKIEDMKILVEKTKEIIK